MNLNKNIYKLFRNLLLFLRLVIYFFALNLVLRENIIFLEWEVIRINSNSVIIGILLDWISIRFLGSVFLIAGSICKFSDFYIEGDSDYTRFILLLISFVFSIVLLIISPNLVRILLGWDGLGLTSYVLVVYYQNERSCNAGILTILSNRIGDVCILISIGLLFFKGSWTFYVFRDVLLRKTILGLIIIAGITKRAQIPFSAWLPAAMAAPTPVSALVHSSTLVTAGVYLIIRFSPCFENTNIINILLIVSTITIIMSGWGANFETDIKKIIALSTLSQLGLIIIIVRAGLPELAFFHLITHAIFKSTLFICGGTIIHISDGSQDSRQISSLQISRPLLICIFALTNLALLGFPFLAGFYSKDLVLERIFREPSNYVLILLIILATGITVSYRLRRIFLGVSSISNLKRVRELIDITKPLFIRIRVLSFFSLLIGFSFHWVFYWEGFALVLSLEAKYYILVICLRRAFIAININLNLKNLFIFGNKKTWYNGFRRMWFLPFMSTNPLRNTSLFKGGEQFNLLDKGWIEYYGATGGQTFFLSSSQILQKGQTRVIISRYLVSFFFVLTLLLLLFL